MWRHEEEHNISAVVGTKAMKTLLFLSDDFFMLKVANSLLFVKLGPLILSWH
jgi:hypothetical protein